MPCNHHHCFVCGDLQCSVVSGPCTPGQVSDPSPARADQWCGGGGRHDDARWEEANLKRQILCSCWRGIFKRWWRYCGDILDIGIECRGVVHTLTLLARGIQHRKCKATWFHIKTVNTIVLKIQFMTVFHNVECFVHQYYVLGWSSDGCPVVTAGAGRLFPILH